MWPRRNANGQGMNEDATPSEAPSTSQPFSLFNPATWLSGLQSGVSNFFGGLFNFGNIFTIGLLAFGAYFLARTEWGQELIKGIAGMLPEDWQVGLGEMLKNIGINIPGLGLDAIQTADQFRNLATNQQNPRQSRLPQSVVDVIAPAGDNATWIRNRTTIAATGANLTSGVSDQLIFGLMFKTTPPAAGAAAGTAASYTPNAEGRVLLRNLLAALPAATTAGTSTPATGTTATTATPDATTASILSAVRSIAADPVRMNLLLADGETRGLMLNAISRFSPVALSAQALDRFITSVGMTEAGQPTAAFTTFIGQALNPSTQGGVSGALVTFLTSPEVAANTSAAASFQALAQSVNLSTITDPTQRQLVQLLKHHAEPTLTLIKTLGQEKAAQLMTLLSAPAQTNEQRAQSTQALTAFVLAEIPAFKTFADTPGLVNALPAGDLRNGLSQLHGMSAQAVEAGRTMIERGVNPVTLANGFVAHDESGAPLRNNQNGPLLTLQPLLTPEGRAQIRTAGVKNVALVANENMPLITERNLNALIGFCETIGTNPNNTRVNGARTGKVMAAIQDMMLNNSSENFKNLTAQELAGFFGDARNNQAFTTLLNTLQVPAGTQGAAQINALKRAWGGEFNGKTESVGNVLATADGAQFVLDELNGRHNSTWMATGQNGSFLGMSATEWQRSWNGLFVSSVRENSDALTLLASAFPTQTARQAPQRPAH